MGLLDDDSMNEKILMGKRYNTEIEYLENKRNQGKQRGKVIDMITDLTLKLILLQ